MITPCGVTLATRFRSSTSGAAPCSVVWMTVFSLASPRSTGRARTCCTASATPPRRCSAGATARPARAPRRRPPRPTRPAPPPPQVARLVRRLAARRLAARRRRPRRPARPGGGEGAGPRACAARSCSDEPAPPPRRRGRLPRPVAPRRAQALALGPLTLPPAGPRRRRPRRAAGAAARHRARRRALRRGAVGLAPRAAGGARRPACRSSAARSMGALRAAELARHGVVGRRPDLRRVPRRHAHRATTRWRCSTPRRRRGTGRSPCRWSTCGERSRRPAPPGWSPPARRRELVEAAEALFYQDRSWGRVVETARLPSAIAAALRRFLPAAPSQKAEDARATLEAALAYARARRAGAPPPPPPDRPPPPTQARRLALDASRARVGEAEVAGREVLAALADRPDAGRLAADGLMRLLLAAQARSLGLGPGDAEVADAEARWLATLGVPATARDAFLAACALDEGETRRLAEGLALEARLRAEASLAIPDGPGWLEGLALGARLSGAWATEAARLARPAASAASRRTRAAGPASGPRSRASARRAPRRGR